MALQNAPRTFSRFIYLFQIRRGLADGLNSGAHRRDSCVPTEAPECPPCEPRPPPPCREPTTSCPSGLRVVCCAPPVGQRPPCQPPQPPVSLTCGNINKQEKISTNCKIEVEGCSSNACGAQLDRVARRLEAAERIRRLEYEREVAKNVSSTPLATPSYPYRLAEEGKCMRATDGHDYKITQLNENERRCDASRNPPPPCPVPLDPIDKCKIKRDTHLDPCSHRPRIFVEIDRSQSLAPSTKPSVSPAHGRSNTAPKRCTSSGNLTSRIFESFKHHENKSEPREANAPENVFTDSKHGIDKKICSNISSLPEHVPTRCKEPSLIERLRRRSGGAISKTDNPRRQFHTGSYILDYRHYSHSSSSPTAFQQKVGSNENKLDTLLQERSQLSEVGQGRVTTSHENMKDDKCIGAGGIELKVPPSAEAVRVRVLLDFTAAMPMSCAKNTVLSPANNRYNNVTSDSETWLSIKNIQKKLRGCRKGENTIEPKKADERKTCIEPRTSQPKQNPCAPQNTTSKTSHTPTCPKSSNRSSSPSPCNQRPSKSSTTKFIDSQNYPIFPF